MRAAPPWLARRARGLLAHCLGIGLKGKVKLVVSFYQIVSPLGRVYVITFPPAYRVVVDGFYALFDLDAFSWIPGLPKLNLRCLGLESTYLAGGRPASARGVPSAAQQPQRS